MDLPQAWIYENFVEELVELTEPLVTRNKMPISKGLSSKKLIDRYWVDHRTTFVIPANWAPPQYIRSPSKSGIEFVQLLKIIGKEIEPGGLLPVVVGDGHIAVTATLQLKTKHQITKTAFEKFRAQLEPGLVIEVNKYNFSVMGTCMHTWKDEITFENQKNLAKHGGKERGGGRSQPRRIPNGKHSATANICSYRRVEDLSSFRDVILEIEDFAILSSKTFNQHHQSLGSFDPDVDTFLEKLPTIPILLPLVQQWVGHLISGIATKWYMEVAWYNFYGTLEHAEMRYANEIKVVFRRHFQGAAKTILGRLARLAGKEIFDPMYMKSGPISKLFEIRRVYKELADILSRKPTDEQNSVNLPCTRRPIKSPKDREASSQENTSSTQVVATQFAAANVPSSPPVLKIGQTTLLELKARILNFEFGELNRGMRDDFIEIVRSIYQAVERGDFHKNQRSSAIEEHISDFYASRILVNLHSREPFPQLQQTSPLASALGKVQKPLEKAETEGTPMAEVSSIRPISPGSTEKGTKARKFTQERFAFIKKTLAGHGGGTPRAAQSPMQKEVGKGVAQATTYADQPHERGRDSKQELAPERSQLDPTLERASEEQSDRKYQRESRKKSEREPRSEPERELKRDSKIGHQRTPKRRLERRSEQEDRMETARESEREPEQEYTMETEREPGVEPSNIQQEQDSLDLEKARESKTVLQKEATAGQTRERRNSPKERSPTPQQNEGPNKESETPIPGEASPVKIKIEEPLPGSLAEPKDLLTRLNELLELINIEEKQDNVDNPPPCAFICTALLMNLSLDSSR
ncbi:hypothetical protein ABW19_dt0203570 [Dactylella cylindrospora]|nr:hypothetical protein ABW19_dt0203570 [Dactylella cylindrospora]